MSTAIHRAVESARTGENPYALARVRSGFLLLGFYQQLRGYCVLMPDPVVPTLNDLRGEARALFLDDMTLVGDVILPIVGARRMNYEILGNAEPALHAHIIPRFDDEPAEFRTKPIFFYPWMNGPEKADPREHVGLMDAIRCGLDAKGVLR